MRSPTIVERGRDAFDNDVVLRRAVERCLEIIGEASKAMSGDVTDTYSEIPWSDMAKVRDRLSHHYHRIDPSQLWAMATRDIPTVARLLRQVEPGG